MNPLAFPVTDVQCQELRLHWRQVRAHPQANGIDYVEVDKVKPTTALVILSLLKGAQIDKENLTVDGLTITKVQPVKPKDGEEDAIPTTYHISVKGQIDCEAENRVRIHAAGDANAVLPGFDPLLSETEFSFGAGAETDHDLPAPPPCPPRELDEPEIYYLAKDYASFRQLILDRLALLMPQWRERHVPDLGITLVELLAYVGDHLSYYQDAVATEAYLDTARQRISVRRHARLVDYHLHEGCNARALLCLISEASDPAVDLTGVYFITDQGLTFPLSGAISRQADLEALARLEKPVRRERYEVFEPVEPGRLKLYYAHNRIDFYTWGERECCLPKGATRAALRDGLPLPPPGPPGNGDAENGGDKPVLQAQEEVEQPPYPPGDEEWLREQLDAERVLHLESGDLLIFEEVIDPGTGLPEDADPAHRHAVRLTRVTPAYDLLNRQAVLEIEWARADALPFPLCLSAVSNDCDYLDGISVARGNVIVVDHGETVGDDLDPVDLVSPQLACDECGEVQMPGSRRYNPHLREKPLVFRETPPLGGPVRYLLQRRDPRQAAPQVALWGRDPRSGVTSRWWPRDDLLSSGGDDLHFVVEMDDERVAHLRFGDDELGEAPPPGTEFRVSYRVGEPLAGNVGAEAIRRLIVHQGIFEGVTGVRNPLEARGGTAPEAVADARLRAPHAFRQRLLRAITPADYARLVEEGFLDQVQRAFATLEPSAQAGRFDVSVWFDPLSGADLPLDDMTDRIQAYLYAYQRIGHDLTVAPGTPVPLDVTIKVKIEDRVIGEGVQEAIEAALGHGGFFCPDRLTFDTGISLSEMVALAQGIPGVAHVVELVVTNTLTGDEEAWPDTVGAGDDLMTFDPGQIPGLGSLTVEWE